jgi:catechol 2,3-dioxygenase-like lactoylglutathione lyase family enzyme
MAADDNAAFGSHKIMAFVATSKPTRARRFYRDILGLRLVKEVVAAEYTVLGWQVPDIVATAKRLNTAGVGLQRYPGMGQDKQGIWTSPSGARIAWFKDPDGNTLSITQF